MSHTPGSWTVDAPDIRVRDARDLTIAYCGNCAVLSKEQKQANALLIAAAPELLEACKQALGAFEQGWAIDWDDLRKAIAAATKEKL